MQCIIKISTIKELYDTTYDVYTICAPLTLYSLYLTIGIVR